MTLAYNGLIQIKFKQVRLYHSCRMRRGEAVGVQ